MTDLKEFYDPDTVQLMNWINTNTKVDESFAGSMQLLAGVKCCTGKLLLIPFLRNLVNFIMFSIFLF